MHFKVFNEVFLLNKFTGNWLRLQLLRKSKGLHLHSVTILSRPRSYSRSQVRISYWYVEVSNNKLEWVEYSKINCASCSVDIFGSIWTGFKSLSKMFMWKSNTFSHKTLTFFFYLIFYYSLGCILAELFTGYPLLPGKTSIQLNFVLCSVYVLVKVVASFF